MTTTAAPPRRPDTSSGLLGGLAVLLLLAAIAVGAGGMLFVSEATLGVAIIALACLIAIIARLVQAAAHNRAVLAELQQRQ